MQSLSVAKTILAVIHKTKSDNLRMIEKHQYAKQFCGSKKKNTFNTAILRLKRDGIIEKRGKHITLTSAGLRAARFAYIDAETKLFKAQVEKWDGGWRIIFFDIPETKRHYRDYLRSTLKSVGFKEFQRSVWVYPYQVPLFLKELLLEDDIRSNVRFISAQKVFFDEDLRALFNIK